jgi:hypothetical protein
VTLLVQPNLIIEKIMGGKKRIGASHLWQRSQESGEELTRSRIDH